MAIPIYLLATALDGIAGALWLIIVFLFYSLMFSLVAVPVWRILTEVRFYHQSKRIACLKAEIRRLNRLIELNRKELPRPVARSRSEVFQYPEIKKAKGAYKL